MRPEGKCNKVFTQLNASLLFRPFSKWLQIELQIKLQIDDLKQISLLVVLTISLPSEKSVVERIEPNFNRLRINHFGARMPENWLQILSLFFHKGLSDFRPCAHIFCYSNFMTWKPYRAQFSERGRRRQQQQQQHQQKAENIFKIIHPYCMTSRIHVNTFTNI